MGPEPNCVFCTKLHDASYHSLLDVRVPELPAWVTVTTALVTLRSLLRQAGLDHGHYGSAQWNPLGTIVPDGAKVVVKPNWVHHHNFSGHGIDCLVTHPHVIEAILHYVAKANPERIVLGDAPIQACDFEALMAACRIPEMLDRFRAHDVNIAVKDFRRTIRRSEGLAGRGREGCRPIEEFVLFDLGAHSSLEAITTPDNRFRVTMYDPDSLKRTHAPGKHQYLVARDVMEADVVINVPKLKTHKKACITGALKNLVGINGHKEYLPHHRKGGSQDGGDCYSSQSRLKSLVETLLDATNRARGTVTRQMLANAARVGMALGSVAGVDNNYEGSWHGNDTVWRMSLDLQRVLHYGRAEGTMADDVQRTVLTITDAIIAGQGEGPLAPVPSELGMMTLGLNTAAVEWIHALLMGMDPVRIPLTREAFAAHRYPLTQFPPGAIITRVNGLAVESSEIFAKHGYAFRAPRGWQGHCELRQPEHAA